MATLYRIRKHSLTLHWNPNCSHWPKNNYDVYERNDRQVESLNPCFQCKTKDNYEMMAMAKKK